MNWYYSMRKTISINIIRHLNYNLNSRKDLTHDNVDLDMKERQLSLKEYQLWIEEHELKIKHERLELQCEFNTI